MSRRAVTAIIGLIVFASSPALAESDPASAGMATPPARGDNIYDHKDHQPTQTGMGGAETAAGDSERPSSGTRQVETEVNKLLQQTDRLDRQMELEEQGQPCGASPGKR